MKKKLVVLTGSFNPITKAHRMILENAINKVGADLGLFVIVSNDYLMNKIIIKKKENKPFILPEETREEMIESLNKYFPKIEYGGVELGGVSPTTVKTLRKIKRKYKEYDLYFSLGADKLKGLSHWSDIETIFDDLFLIVYPRVGYNIDEMIENDSLLSSMKEKIIILDDLENAQGISSTKIRESFFNNIDYKELMDEGPYKVLSRLNPSDYKTITGDDLIKCQLLYGGRFGGNAARKQVYLENVKIFNNWNENILGNRNDKFIHTKVYRNEFRVTSNNNFETEFMCDNMDCADAALNLIKEGLNPAILNLASNHMPCGGYFDGSSAQEESLCQMSTLSLSLYQFANPKLKCFKEANVASVPNVYPMDINFGGIYSPNVCFFRNNIEKYYSLRDNTFTCPIITVASLSNREKNNYTNDERKYFNEDGTLNDEGKSIEANKIRTIYRIALDNNHDSIVLGAFGCGVYNLRPDEISKLFLDILNESEFKDKFKKIVFAILEGKAKRGKMIGNQGKFKPFYDLFAK